MPIAGHDTVCGLLWEVGAVGIESIGELVRVTLPTDCVDAAGALLAGHGASPTAAEPVDPNAWKDLWREWAAAVRVESDVVITPAWIEPPSRPGDVVIEVEPGDAWGHGAHPTTTLVVAALRAMGRLDGRRMLDVGCGSGVLSVAAARFGAADVVAVDIEPAAIVATADNAARNGVASQVVASLTPVESVAGTFDLVAANIGAGALIAMAPRLAASLSFAARHIRIVPVRLTSIVWRKASISNSLPPRWIIPAQFTSASMRGQAATVAATSSSCVTSSLAWRIAAWGGAAATSASVRPVARTS